MTRTIILTAPTRQPTECTAALGNILKTYYPAALAAKERRQQRLFKLNSFLYSPLIFVFVAEVGYALSLPRSDAALQGAGLGILVAVIAWIFIKACIEADRPADREISPDAYDALAKLSFDAVDGELLQILKSRSQIYWSCLQADQLEQSWKDHLLKAEAQDYEDRLDASKKTFLTERPMIDYGPRRQSVRRETARDESDGGMGVAEVLLGAAIVESLDSNPDCSAPEPERGGGGGFDGGGASGSWESSDSGSSVDSNSNSTADP